MMGRAPKPSIGIDRFFMPIMASFLFAYAGLVLAVIWADAWWLLKPLASGSADDVRWLHAPDALAQIRTAILLTFGSTLFSSLLAMVVAAPAAYYLSRYRVPCATFVDVVIDLPIVMPPLLAGISLLIFFNQFAPGMMIDRYLGVMYTFKGIVIAQFFVSAAFCIRAVKAAIDQVNPRFEQVARTLGCGPFRAFWKITLPLAKNGLMAGWIMTWARAVGEFAPIMIIFGARSDRNVLPVVAFLNLSEGNIEISVAVTLIMIAIAAGTLIAFKKLGGQGYLW